MNQLASAAQDRWRELIRRQSASGLSVAEFCRRDRVPASSFFAWKRNLGPSPAAPAFVEVVVAARPDGAGADPRPEACPGDRRSAGVIEIRLRGGRRRVRVGRGFDRALLAEVVAVLEALA
jgi:hypothetical protein